MLNSEAPMLTVERGYYATLLVTKPGQKPCALAQGRPQAQRAFAMSSLLCVLAVEVNVGESRVV